MNIVFHSNYMNHHQYAFCNALIEKGVNLYFIAHKELSQERKNLGYRVFEGDFILQATEENEELIYKLTMEADAVIFGSKPDRLFRDRVNSGKLTFNYSERLFKKGRFRAFYPPLNLELRDKYLFNKKNAPFVLCASAFAAGDYKLLGYPNDRFLKWGYFPDACKSRLEEILPQKVPGSIIWVARLIDWKHPEYVVNMAQKLKDSGIDFHVKMIGTGPLEKNISDDIVRKGLSEYVELTGAMSNEEVLKEFRRAEIALITSDKNEGWGAVVNEAMGSACAVIACDQIGSVRYLIESGKNGLTFQGRKITQMLRHVKKLLSDETLRAELSKNAYKTVSEVWNYRVAAERLIKFIEDRTVYGEGPVSQG